jgi:hypothetical protein
VSFVNHPGRNSPTASRRPYPEGHGLRESLLEDTPVDHKDYQVSFRFSGKIDKLTAKLGPEELLAVQKGKVAKKFRTRP